MTPDLRRLPLSIANVHESSAAQGAVATLRYNMAMSEFDLIAKYFTRPAQPARADVVLGIGDDCALLEPARLIQAISTDMLIEGRHFFTGANARALGHKALAVNLSDLAAMGARPRGFTLALALPAIEPDWLAEFSAGLFALADAFECDLIGGDTTRGPRTICITIFGEVARDAAFRRDAAQVGDDIWVSGVLGEARLALADHNNEIQLDPPSRRIAQQRMDWPSPRVALGLALHGLVHAAIDISDGLVGDLGHILSRSQVGACLQVDDLPTGDAFAAQPEAMRLQYCLNGGDDYELCFTAPAHRREQIGRAALAADTPVTRIGCIERAPGLRLHHRSGATLDLTLSSFDHFITN